MVEAPTLGLQDLLHRGDEPTQLRKQRERHRPRGSSAMLLQRASSFASSSNMGVKDTPSSSVSLDLEPAPGIIRAPSSEGAQALQSPWLKTERKFEGEFARALVIKDDAEAELVKNEEDTKVDISVWHLELVVNKLQGTEYFRQRLIITPDVIAMGTPMSSLMQQSLSQSTKHKKNLPQHTWDDVVPLHQITSVRELEGQNKEAASEQQVPDEQCMLGIYTDVDGHNKGRKYCLQIVGTKRCLLMSQQTAPLLTESNVQLM